MKKITALILILALALSLAACGKDGGGDKQQDVAPGVTTASGFAYKADYKEIGKYPVQMEPLLFTEEGVYVLIPEETDGAPAVPGLGIRAKGDYYMMQLYLLGYDGSLKRIDSYTPWTQENTENYQFFTAYGDLAGMSRAADGGFVMLEHRYVSYVAGDGQVEEYSDEYWANYVTSEEYYVLSFDSGMNKVGEAKADMGQIGYIQGSRSLITDDSGNILAFCMDDEGGGAVAAIAPDGSVAYTVSCGGDEGGEGYKGGYIYISELVRLGDGRIGAVMYDNERTLNILDFEAKKLGESYVIPDEGYDLFTGDGSYDFYYRTGSRLCGYKLDTGESTEVINWVNSDINGNSVNGVYIRPDGGAAVMCSTMNEDYTEHTAELVNLEKVPADSLPHKDVLTLAMMYMDSRVVEQAVKFNRSSDTCRIEVKDYSEYNTDDDWSAGLTKLNTEILSGNVPDIISLDRLNYRQLAAKGLLEDLYPYLDADPDLGRDSIIPNVLKAMEADGKLCQLVPTFNIVTAVGAASVVGDKPGWTYEQYRAALATMPAGCETFDFSTTRSDVLSSCLSIEINNFVDWEAGKCYFDSQDFVNLLEFCNGFRESFDWENYNYSPEDDTATRIMSGRQMLIQAYLYDFMSAARYEYYFGGEDTATFIGYPVSQGIGSAIRLDSGFAVSSDCKNKDAAWQFLRYFISADYQKSLNYTFPANKEAFDAKLKEAMTVEYRKDENGSTVLDEDGQPVKLAKDGVYFKDGTEYEIYALSQTQADKITSLIDGIDTYCGASEITDSGGASSNPIVQIVTEEVQAYFAGQKTAQDVAKLIQSKVNLYVNEQR